jgi:LysR family transcriptional regulator, glycine cleavage system transcriptional activator
MLRAIYAFEASATKLSFIDAARELNVTPAAVGQQVRALEQWLGVTLFERARYGESRLTLTEHAKLALPDLSDGFDRLDAGLRRLRNGATRPTVSVSVSQAFMARWLMPRLHEFTDAHQDIDVRLDVTDRVVDVAAGDADVAIRCGAGAWRGVEAIHLMAESFVAVCSPQLAKQMGVPISAADLANWPLVHDTTLERSSVFPTWHDWFKKFRVRSANAAEGLRINSTSAVIEAALRGQGVALSRRALVDGELASGRLIRLFDDIEWPVDWHYYLVRAKERTLSPAATLFIRWVIDAALAYNERVASTRAVRDASTAKSGRAKLRGANSTRAKR